MVIVTLSLGRDPLGKENLGSYFSSSSYLALKGLSLHHCMSSPRDQLFYFYFLIYVWKPGYSASGSVAVGWGTQSMLSILASCLCVCCVCMCVCKAL